MRFELKLALTYLRSKKKSIARFTAIAAVIGIATGVASLIFAQALSRGFQEEMRDKILANTPHIAIFRKDGLPFDDQKQICESIAAIENVANITETTFENALIIGKSTTQPAILRVVSSEEKRISLGSELAEKTGLQVNESADIIVTESEQPIVSTIKIDSVFRTGMYDYDSTWIDISATEFARIHHHQNFHPTVLNITLVDIYASGKTAEKIRDMLATDFRVIDWQESNQPLFAALSLEKKMSLVIISLIIFVAALNIATTLSLLVNERRLDLAILRTCGATSKELILIFLYEGIALGIFGIIVGIIIGLSACAVSNHFDLVRLNAEVYSLSQVTLKPNYTDILRVALVAICLCFLSAIYPAIKASRLKPIENLKAQ